MPERTEKAAMSAPTPVTTPTGAVRTAESSPSQPVITQPVKREAAAVIDKKTDLTGNLIRKSMS
jgi:hypothetical protein